MTELEWLKQVSGYTDEELKSFETVMGSAKFVAMLQKIHQTSEQATSDKAAAEQARIDLEHRYTNEFIPEMRKVTTDALKARGEAARYQAELAQAREYGIVPEAPASAVVDPPRAPGSPDPNMMTRDDFGKFSQSQANTIITLNDINAEHFRLFGAPLGGTQELVDEVQRQRTLGQKNFTLRQAWEQKHNVTAKRDEISKAERQKETDVAVQAALKTEREKAGANPHSRTGKPSRFSNYSATDAASGKEPWKAPHSKKQANAAWRENAIDKVREAQAA